MGVVEMRAKTYLDFVFRVLDDFRRKEQQISGSNALLKCLWELLDDCRIFGHGGLWVRAEFGGGE